MANPTMFQSQSSVPEADATNKAGGKAYLLPAKLALAQYAVTGTFNNTYYATGEDQINEMLNLCKQVEPAFVAKLAVFARRNSFMKDTPAFLLAYLSTVNVDLLAQVFPLVVDNGKMLRNFVQIIRSGVMGRKSFGSRPRNIIRNWLRNRGNEQLLSDSVGNNPSIGDVIRMTHVKAKDKEQNAMFAYLCGFGHDVNELPAIVSNYEKFKLDNSGELPKVRFELLTSLNLTKDQWTQIARNSSWSMVRQNLNTFKRHGVLENKEMVDFLANKLSDPEQIRRANVFPYQLLITYLEVSKGLEMPRQITNALQDALEIATENVPSFDCSVVAFPDVSGSMSHPATGFRKGSTSVARCIDIAALVAATVLRKNPISEVLPFDGQVENVVLNPRDSVMTNAQKLGAIGGGSTYCVAPMKQIMDQGKKVDLFIYISDNESWVNGSASSYSRRFGQKGTELAELWRIYRKFNSKAKLVCIDITPQATAQVLDDKSILNIGGFSDNIWQVINNFVKGNEHFVDEIEKININYME